MNLVSALSDRLPWTAGRTGKLVLRINGALGTVGDKFAHRVVPVAGGRVAWGQYLDDHHHSDAQWGIYGTSAGIQVLALGSHHLLAQAVAMPDDLDNADTIYDSKRERGQFDNLIKLVFIAEGINPEAATVADAPPPAVIETIFARRKAGNFWSTRPEAHPSKDVDFPTSVVLLALARYDAAIGDERYRAARRWLAERVLNDRLLKTPTNLALAGLALKGRPGTAINDDRVSDAIETCRSELLERIRDQPIVLDRPIFYGFSMGESNDYLFLHPEILTALFFLRADTVDARGYVLRVTRRLLDNIEREKAFMGQSEMISSVDQLWAARLLRELHSAHDARPEQVIPPFGLRIGLGTWWGKALAALAALGVAYGGYSLSGGGLIKGGGSLLAGLAMFVFAAILARRGQK